MSWMREYLRMAGKRHHEIPQRGLPDDDGNEYHGASAIGGEKPAVSEFQPRHTPTRPVRTAISIPQGIRHGTRELASASRLDGSSNANRPRR